MSFLNRSPLLVLLMGFFCGIGIAWLLSGFRRAESPSQHDAAALPQPNEINDKHDLEAQRFEDTHGGHHEGEF